MNSKTNRIPRLPYFLFLLSYSLLLFSCSVSKQINKQAEKLLFADSAIKQGHIGISIYDPAAGKYIYNHNADKYFIPASNTKLFTWYAGMKYLGDSLVGFKYEESGDTLYFKPQADPTFLHPDFKNQLFFEKLKKSGKKISIDLSIITNKRFDEFGKGWSWDDYQSSYMAERSTMPIYGNVATYFSDGKRINSMPTFFLRSMEEPMMQLLTGGRKFSVKRSKNENDFSFYGESDDNFSRQEIPFITHGEFSARLLLDTLNINSDSLADFVGTYDLEKKFKTQSSDSLFKLMMHRSDNFFAEQTLLMVSNVKLDRMNDIDIIDTLLSIDLTGIPQEPRWVDGSGLSRYNLFTPQDFVWLLDKTKKEFSWDRIKNILATGGEGTLSSYYKEEAGFIYAKTGTLSNNYALSGYLITRKNKLLIFSVLVNNYPTGATPVRRSVEKFIKSLREKY